MALSLVSPCGLLSDEEEGPAVFESTAADLGGLAGLRNGATLPGISMISPGLDPPVSVMEKSAVKPGVLRQGGSDEGSAEKVRVYLRIRPLTEGEKDRGEEQGCVCIQNDETLMLKAPKDSQAMKSAERGISHSMHKFSFSQIFGPETRQQDLFESTMKEMVRDVLRGESRLLYTYGVTNSGKTYTIQGVGREAGLLPRALASVFRRLQGRLYAAMDLKPVLCHDVRQLSSGEVRIEEMRRDSLLKEEESSRVRGGGTSASWDSGVGHSTTSPFSTQMEDTDSVCLEPDSLSLSGGEELGAGVRFSLWVSFYEIYNEFLYDLLEAPPSLAHKKRTTLRLSDDKQGNPYVKDLIWIQVRSAEEAWRVLRAGRRNQSFASTHLNHNSSRSHSIFSLRVLHVHPDQATSISELAVCDLAGSERCKLQLNGERMKEASNINTSLHTLGRCITALRHNQNHRSRPPQVVPFRDSKLTRVLQGYFCGRGRSAMVVNINPCASTYDETLQALKFSAIATQLVHGPATRTRVAYIMSLLREPPAPHQDSTLEEEEEEEDSEEEEEEGDITAMFHSEDLLRAIDVLKGEVHRQRAEKEGLLRAIDALKGEAHGHREEEEGALEARVREQVVSEVMEVVSRMETQFLERLETERALMEKRSEDQLSNLQKHLKRYYSEEIEDRDDQIKALTAALEAKEKAGPGPGPGSAPGPIFPPLEEQGWVRRSKRLASSSGAGAEEGWLRAQLDQCRAELQEKTQELKSIQGLVAPAGLTGTLTSAADRKLDETQRNLRQLRLDLQRLGVDLQSGGRACCRNTDAERLRHGLEAAHQTLAKQDQTLMELQNNLLLVKVELKRGADSRAQAQAAPPPTPTPGSCQKRGGAAGSENHPPEKRPFFRSIFPLRTARNATTPRAHEGVSMATTPYSRVLRPRNASPGIAVATTPYSGVLRSRQQSPPPSPHLCRAKV